MVLHSFAEIFMFNCSKKICSSYVFWSYGLFQASFQLTDLLSDPFIFASLKKDRPVKPGRHQLAKQRSSKVEVPDESRYVQTVPDGKCLCPDRPRRKVPTSQTESAYDLRAFMSRPSCVHQTFVRSCPDFRAFTRLSCVHQTIRAFMIRLSCVHQTIRAFMIRLSCVHQTIRAFMIRLSCVHQTIRAFMIRLSCVFPCFQTM